MDSLISVIVPVYKVEKYLPQCVDSILAQTYRNLEIILVDDGSPDGCAAICDEYAKKDNRVRVIHQKNAGVSAARNAGLDCAQGEYIGFVDSDDFIAPEMFEALLSLIKKYHVSISMCQYRHVRGVTQGKDALSFKNDSTDGVWPVKEALHVVLTQNNYAGFLWNKLYHRSLFNGKEPVRLDPAILITEDMLAVVQCMLNCGEVAYTTQPYYGARINPDSVMNSGFSKKFLTDLIARRKFTALLPPDLSEIAKAIYAERASFFLCSAYALKLKDAIPYLKKECRKHSVEFHDRRKFFPLKDRIRVWGTQVCAPVFCRLWNLLKAIRPRRDVSG